MVSLLFSASVDRFSVSYGRGQIGLCLYFRAKGKQQATLFCITAVTLLYTSVWVVKKLPQTLVYNLLSKDTHIYQVSITNETLHILGLFKITITSRYKRNILFNPVEQVNFGVRPWLHSSSEIYHILAEKKFEAIVEFVFARFFPKRRSEFVLPTSSFWVKTPYC